MKRRRAVALLIETSNAYARGLLEGIIEYTREHDEWSIFLPEQERGSTPPSWLKNWKGDGLIARIETEEIASAVLQTRLPVIDCSAARHVPNIPWVETDDRAIAQLAAEHLLERGFKHLAYCGEPHFNWSRWRQEQFVELVRQAGRECHVFEAKSRFDAGYSWNREQRRLLQWVEKLPKPVGVMACYDLKAQQLLDVCRELDISVPEQVAVIGVDDDHLLCNLCTPPLTSVAPDVRRTGYIAASLLDRLMSGQPVAEPAHFIQPLGVAVRKSTDVLAIEDEYIARAVRMIREHACDGINVHDLLRNIPLSRRVLESRFYKILGKTPHKAILEYRLERVRQLLRETDLPLATIAARAGFEHVEYMSVAFKKQFGVAPGRYRREVVARE